MRKLAFVMCLTALLAATTLVGGSGASTRVHKDTLHITIGLSSPTANAVLATLAKNAGLFPSNLDVDVKVYSSATIIAPLASGDVQMALAGSPIIEQAVISQGPIIQYLAAYFDPPDVQLVVRPDVNTFNDLKGKRIGITVPGGLAALLTNVALNQGKLTPNDFSLLPLGSVGNLTAAFVGGSVSAVPASPPSTSAYLRLVPGSKVLWDSYTAKIDWLQSAVSGNSAWVKRHPAATVAVLKALNDALKLFKSNPTMAKQAIQQLSGISDPGDLQDAWDSMNKRATNKLVPVKLSTIQNVLRILRENQAPQAKASLAKTMIASPAYLQKALGVKTQTKKK
jgi:NitT/TauT family transport system substrate-binding protein